MTSPDPRDHQGPLMQAGQARPCSPNAEQSTGATRSKRVRQHPSANSKGRPCPHLQSCDDQHPLAQAVHASPCSPVAEQPTGRYRSINPTLESRSPPWVPRGPTNPAHFHLRKWHHQPEPCLAPTVSSKSPRIPPHRCQEVYTKRDKYKAGQRPPADST